MAIEKETSIPDGSMDWSGGVDSIKATTVATQSNPGGLQRNQLAWLENGVLRDGGISPRAGWQPIATMHPGTALYQGGFMYEPVADFPYLIHAIGGIIYRQDMTTGDLTQLSDATTMMPASLPYFHFVQAEQFLVIQAGDFVTLPLFWDGTTLRRSVGITNTAVAPGTPGVNEIPAAGTMDYYMGRLWYAQQRQYSAGDIVQGASGTPAYQFRDSVLNVTENPLVVGGDGFVVPTSDGNIRALRHSANLDAALGQGRLFIFTRKAVYALQVPVTRTDWIAATSSNQPLQTVVQLVNGAVSDRSVVPTNGDLFYQSLEPGIRSLMQAVRNFSQWGNIEISANERRVLQFNDRGLMGHSSGIQFDNRLLMTALPFETSVGIAHKAIIPMDFMPINSFQSQKAPNWEGVYSGLDHLQLFTGDFGGLERAFTVVVSRVDGSIQLWELTQGSRTENGDGRVTWIIEFPSFNWQRQFELKKLICAEMWIDRLWGTAEFLLEYRPDGQTCWNFWHRWQKCSPRNSAEDADNPITYPLVEYGECYKSTMTTPRPPEACSTCNTGRPANVGYQMQARLTIKGYCRLRGFLLHGEPVGRKLYEAMTC